MKLFVFVWHVMFPLPGLTDHVANGGPRQGSFSQRQVPAATWSLERSVGWRIGCVLAFVPRHRGGLGFALRLVALEDHRRSSAWWLDSVVARGAGTHVFIGQVSQDSTMRRALLEPCASTENYAVALGMFSAPRASCCL